MNIRYAFLALGLSWVSLNPVSTAAWPFGPKGDDVAEKRANVRQQRNEMLGELFASSPALRDVVKNAEGYATFKNVQVNLLLVASANGYGLLVDNRTGKETYMRMGSLGGGVGAGLKDVRAVFIFHDRAKMKQFVEEGWQFGGQADMAAKYKDTGVAAEQSAKANVSVKDRSIAGSSTTDITASSPGSGSSTARATAFSGVEIYQFTESGVALQATLAGTKYWKDTKLN